MGLLLNLFQCRHDAWSPRLVLAPAGRNYCVLEKLADDDRQDGHYRRF
jgi:hypothetical protein